MRIYCMQVRICLLWKVYGIVEFHLRLQFYSIPFLVETPSLAFSTHSLLKVPNSRIIPTLTFQFQSPAISVPNSINHTVFIQLASGPYGIYNIQPNLQSLVKEVY